jgi:hypothetical protein
MLNLRIKSNAVAFQKRWKARIRELESRTKKTPGVVAQWGAAKAKTIAPVDTGTLVQSISWATNSKSKNATASIYVRRANRPGYRDERDRTTFYAYQMHYGWPGFHPHGGKDRFFMFTTRKLVKKKFGEELRLAIGRFVK